MGVECVCVECVCEQGVIQDFEVEGGENKTSVTRTFWLKKRSNISIPC